MAVVYDHQSSSEDYECRTRSREQSLRPSKANSNANLYQNQKDAEAAWIPTIDTTNVTQPSVQENTYTLRDTSKNTEHDSIMTFQPDYRQMRQACDVGTGGSG